MQKMKKLITITLAIILLMTAVSVCACGDDHINTSSPVRFFPVVKESLLVETMRGDLKGILVLDNGYLKMNHKYSDSVYLLIWPYGFSSRVEDEEIQVIDNNGQVVARAGDQITVGGRFVYKGGLLEECTAQPLPSDCAELRMCWLVSEVLDDNSESSNTESDKYADLFEKYKDDAALFQAAVYAEHIGVTVEEALRRFEIKDAFRGLQTNLKSNETETFAGLYLQHTPEFRIVVLFTHNGEETIKHYIPEGMDEYVEVRTAEVSYADLQDARNEVSSAFESLGIKSDSCTYVRENRVEFNVLAADWITIDNAIRDGKLRVPDCVDIITVRELARPSTNVYGGL